MEAHTTVIHRALKTGVELIRRADSPGTVPQGGDPELPREFLEFRRGTVPPQVLDGREDGYVGSQRGERAKQHRERAMRFERGGEPRGATYRHLPLLAVGGDFFEMTVATEQGT